MISSIFSFIRKSLICEEANITTWFLIFLIFPVEIQEKQLTILAVADMNFWRLIEDSVDAKFRSLVCTLFEISVRFSAVCPSVGRKVFFTPFPSAICFFNYYHKSIIIRTASVVSINVKPPLDSYITVD